MDWSRYPLEKLFSFVAALIPGFTALLISGRTADELLYLSSLGYRSRVTVILVIAFVVGFTLTTCLSALLGAIGGVIGSVTYKAPESYAVAPWRDPTWRELIKKKLGANAPSDTRPISSVILELRQKMINNLPTSQQQPENLRLQQDQLATEADDLAWSVWYDHYHKIAVMPDEKDVFLQVHTGLRFSLQTASLYCLTSALVVPSLRHWWYLAPAVFWVVTLVIESVNSLQKALNKWSSLHDQIKYLTNN